MNPAPPVTMTRMVILETSKNLVVDCRLRCHWRRFRYHVMTAQSSESAEQILSRFRMTTFRPPAISLIIGWQQDHERHQANRSALSLGVGLIMPEQSDCGPWLWS